MDLNFNDSSECRIVDAIDLEIRFRESFQILLDLTTMKTTQRSLRGFRLYAFIESNKVIDKTT
jgi:hypothetical protein